VPYGAEVIETPDRAEVIKALDEAEMIRDEGEASSGRGSIALVKLME
jgi:hypothetical protein